jgi:hypothetical protein
VLAFRTKVRVFKPAEAVGFFMAKKILKDNKAVGSMS